MSFKMPSTVKSISEAQPAQVSSLAPAKKAKLGKGEIYFLLFSILLESMDTRQNTVYLQAKELSTNAQEQELQNRLDRSLQFVTIPPNATTKQIDRIQNENEAIASERQDIQNTLITLRQESQVMMTQTNTNVNSLEQDASMNSGWLKTLGSIFQVINQISQPI